MSRFGPLARGVLAIVVATAIGCAATPTRESTGEYFDDSWITAKVKAAIFSEENLKSAEINVETFKGEVQLSGYVSSGEGIRKAVALARATKGVRSVRNDMHVKGR